MSTKPEYQTGVICTICLTSDTVALIDGDIADQSTSGIVWCENGHVVALHGEPRKSTLVFDFNKGAKADAR